MKKIFLNFIVIVVLSSCIVTTKAQLYLKAFTGYSFCSYPITYAIFQETINNSVSAKSFKYKPGNGLQIGLVGGYDINSTIGVEISANFIVPHTQKGQYQFSKDFVGRVTAFDLQSINKVYNFSSMLVYTIPCKKKANIYIKAGPNFLLHDTKLNNTITEYDKDNKIIETIEAEKTIKGKINIGFQGAIGVCFKQTKRVSFFSEFNIINSNYLYKNYTYTEGNYNKSEDISERIIYNSLAFNVGVKYNLTGSK